MLSLRGKWKAFIPQAAWALKCLPVCRATRLLARATNRVDSYHISCEHFLWLGFDYSCIFPNAVGQRYNLLHVNLKTNSWSVETPGSMDVLCSLTPQNLSHAGENHSLQLSCPFLFPSSDHSLWVILVCVCVCVCVSCSAVSDSLWPHGLQPTGLFCPWNSPGKNTGVGSHSLLLFFFLFWIGCPSSVLT